MIIIYYFILITVPFYINHNTSFIYNHLIQLKKSHNKKKFNKNSIKNIYITNN